MIIIDIDDGCILLKFYIKPQRWKDSLKEPHRCILLKFYIKPQRRDSYVLKMRYLQSFSNS